MDANARSRRLPWLTAIAGAALVAVLLVAFFRHARTTGAAPESESRAAVPAGDSPSAPLPPGAQASPPGPTAGALARSPAGPPAGNATNEYPVDLELVRARLPDNLYWRLGQPTQDPELLRLRAEEERRWNELYGKVLSSAATEEEVHRYYEHRRQLSEDYIELASLVLAEYGDRLPDRDRGLYELSIEMHSARLAEIPRQIEDALARKRAQDQRREEWRRSQ